MKKLTIILILFALYIPAVAAYSPVAHWKLDEDSGTTAYDSAGTNNGTLLGSPVWKPTDGKINGALEFYGTVDYVQITGYKGVIGTQSRTCTTWIKTDTAGAIISWGNNNVAGGKWFVRLNSGGYGNAGALRVSVADGYIIGSTNLSDAAWHHVAAVLDSDGTPNVSDIKLYVDGVLESISDEDSEPIVTGSYADVEIGAFTSNSSYFTGLIDDVRIYDRPLSAEEILQLYEGQLDNLDITPSDDFESTGESGGPFTPASKDYQLTNIGDDTLSWDLQYSADWLDVSDTSGTLDPDESATVTVSINAAAETLGRDIYTDTLVFRNTTDPAEMIEYQREVILTVYRTLYVPTPEYPTIQDGIDAAVDGDVVVVSDGTYTGQGNTYVNFHGKAITVKSQNGPENCIVDCQNQYDRIGFRFMSGEERNSVLDGFTITGGTNGGIVCGGYSNEYNASPTITNCIIRDNTANEYRDVVAGGGISCREGSSPLISNCIIENNTSSEKSFNWSGGGGGLYCLQADVTVINCIIRNNIVDGYWANSGGGIYSEDSTLLIINSVIADNSCPGLYGWNEYNSNGGGIFCAASEVTIVNSTIAGNSADYMGGGIYSDYSEVTLRNCIVWGNSARLGTNLAMGATYLLDDYNYGSTMSVSYSDIQGGQSKVLYRGNDADILYWGEGNLDIDPVFFDRTNQNYHLFPWSPCIDAGDNTALDLSVVTDLDGTSRFFDDPNTIDTGQGTPPIVDMGPYEFWPEPRINVSPDVLQFSVYLGQPEPVITSFQVSNLGTETLNWSMNGVCEWLIVDKLSGSLPFGFDIIRLNIDITSLPLGTNQCQLTVSSPEAINSPQTLTVIVNVFDPLRVPAEFDTIQSAVDAAADGDFVVVADGVYTGEGNTNVSFEGKAITVRSENGPENCIIDAQNLSRGFRFITNEGPDSVLNGFTIVNGLMPRGGGIRVDDYCGPQILNCIVKNCTAETQGGGIHCGFNSSTTIEDCLVFNNTSGDLGGGICYDPDSVVRIYNCDILNNSANTFGGGIYITYGSVEIEGCQIDNNTTENYGGGGMFLDQNSQINITNCSIENNISAGGGGGIHLRYYLDRATLTNCLFRNNTAGTRGGGLRLDEYSADHGAVRVVNCTFADNRAPEGGGLYGYGLLAVNSIFVNNNNSAIDGSCTINYCHFYDNPDGDYWHMTGADEINDIEGNSNNLDGDPMLTNDLHLLADSPCIDAGDNTAIDSLIVTDLDGRPRFYDDPNTIDTGNPPGAQAIVDIGAYEFSPLLWISASSAAPFTAYWSQTDPIEEEFKINNIGVSSLNFQISEDCDWLQVEPDSGSISGYAEKSLSLTVDVSELEPDHPDQVVGNYYCTLTISSAEAVNSPVLVDITLRVVKPLTVPTKYDTIQSAVDAAGYRDIVLVADGTYTGEGNVNVSFLGKAITVRSENGPENCIIDGQGLSRGFRFIMNEDSDSVLNGFTIVNGLMPRGGGIRVDDYCGPQILNCIVKNCTAETEGGGIHFGIGSSTTIKDCLLFNNTAGDIGGGVCSNEASSVVINNCDIVNNSANTFGGGIWIYATYGSVDIEQCQIDNNTTENYGGGGMFLDQNSQINITNCSIENNISAGGGGGIHLRYYLDRATLTNCLFRNNTAGTRGGGLRLDEYSVDDRAIKVVNCTFADNRAPEGGGLYGYGLLAVNSIFVNNNNSAIDGSCTINYCHFYDNPDGDYWHMTGADEINDIEGNSNNLDGDPMLSSDLHLLSGSPCIDAGHNSFVIVETDLDGNPRIINGIVDIGAYEANYIEVSMKLTPQTLNCSSSGNWFKAHFVLPEGYLIEDVDTDKPAAIDSLTILSDHMNVFYNNEGLVEIEVAFSRNDFCSIGLYGNIELTVWGSLTTGQNFIGTDTIRVAANTLQLLVDFSAYWLQTDCAIHNFCEGFDLDQNGIVDLADFALLAEN